MATSPRTVHTDGRRPPVGSQRGKRRAWTTTTGRRYRAAVRFANNQFHGGYLDRGFGPDHLCLGCDAGHEGSSGRSSELPGMARRRSVQLSGGNHWATFGQANLLVLCDHFHFHSVGELVWFDSRGGYDRLGASNPKRFRYRRSLVSRRECRSESDAGYGAHFFRLLDRLGIARGGPSWIPQRIVCAQG